MREAERELFAARYGHAAELYSRLLHEDSGFAGGYYGLVRAHIGGYRAPDAYAAAEEALRRVPETAEGQSAAAMAAWRRGDVLDAELFFKKAYKLNPNFAGAFYGLASVYSSVSKYKSARALLATAHRLAPDDPEITTAWANTLQGAAHIAALEQVLAVVDPETREARILRAHVAADKSLGDRRLRRLTSPYQSYAIKLERIMDGPTRWVGAGLHVKFNQQTYKLMLDTGASGISISPKAAEKAGLQILSDESSEARGIGDDKAQASFRYLANEISIGDVTFAEVPISVFRSAKTSNFDGLIGADVFSRFIVGIDFGRMELTLGTHTPDGDGEPNVPVDASDILPNGFFRAMRFGNHLTIPTSINGQAGRLFLIDSGSSINVIDTSVAETSTKLYRDGTTVLTGIQGRVKKVDRASRVTLVFAGFKQENPDLLATSLEKLGDSMGVGIAGVLGMPVLSHLKFTIDYRDGAVRFEFRK